MPQSSVDGTLTRRGFLRMFGLHRRFGPDFGTYVDASWRRIKWTIWRSPDNWHAQHGPQTWPWWRLFGWLFVKLRIHPPSTGYRLWVYLPARAFSFDLFIDRRPEKRT